MSKKENENNKIVLDQSTGQYMFPDLELVNLDGDIEKVQIRAQKLVRTAPFVSAFSKYNHDGDISHLANALLPVMIIEPSKYRNMEAFGNDIEGLNIVVMGLFELQRNKMPTTKRKLEIQL